MVVDDQLYFFFLFSLVSIFLVCPFGGWTRGPGWKNNLLVNYVLYTSSIILDFLVFQLERFVQVRYQPH